jgi:zinc D-Ala-D-Ala dipeptidase
MTLVPIAPPQWDVTVDLAYATPDNVTGRPIYARPLAYLHSDAAAALARAVTLAAGLGLRLRLYDAFRPTEAQWALWNFRPDPTFVADPRRGSPHSRGVAVDVTLETPNQDGGAVGGVPLTMGTLFDDFTERSYHGALDIPAEAQRNRLLLLGLMSAAGWDFYSKEWWHYQLFDARRYPLYSDSALAQGLMS